LETGVFAVGGAREPPLHDAVRRSRSCGGRAFERAVAGVREIIGQVDDEDFGTWISPVSTFTRSMRVASNTLSNLRQS